MCPTNQFRNTDISCPGPLQDLKLIKVSVVSGVAVVTFDNPHSKVNSFSFDFLIEIWKVLSYFEDHASEFVGMAILSAKPDNYFAGADVKMLYDCDRKMALHVSKSGQQTVKRLAMLPFPTVAAVMGPCLGGGLEMVLSTKYVLAVDTPKTVFGVPEVMIGLIPAGGGCNFLPRKINVIEAISMIATGKKVGAGKAHSLGLVDELVEARFDDADTLQCLEMRAIECVMELSEGSLQYGRLSVYNHLLLKSMSVKIIRDYVMNRARQDILDKSHGHYPSPLAAIDVIEKSLSEGIEVGLEYEQLRFADVAETPQSRSLIRLFDGQTSFKKNKFDVTIEPFKNVIIVGSEQDTLAKYILESYESKYPNVIFVTTDVLSSTDIPSGQVLVIDTTLGHNSAVSAIESRFCNSDYLIIKITDRKTLHQVCQESSAPDKLLVGRYFRPHEKSQFVELTQSPHVCNKKMAAVSEAILNSGKSVLVVRDKAGLFMTRIFAMFAFEGMRLLLEGLNLEDLETLTRRWASPSEY
ncbi:Trifunctional enzyme subunit alpha, mitochondrial [Halotydeus destructor]|nr:Trifunctional enzyme subunit alpha, mitochondrial [Halotydeus destructor]